MGHILGCVPFRRFAPAAATAALLTIAGPSWGSPAFSPDHPRCPKGANGIQTDVPSIAATPLDGARIKLDGRLDEPIWDTIESGTGFRRWEPDRGSPVEDPTVFKVAYDADAMYFGVAVWESDPSQISQSLCRRDQISDSDLVSVYIDPYLDHTTGYNFRVNPLGVQEDSYMYNDGNRDRDWNAVWEAETSRDERGWYVEMRIPFSSIRYRPADTMTWGLQVYRYMHGRGLDESWVTWEEEQNGFVSRFGTVTGIRDVSAPRQLEVTPYVVQRLTNGSVSPSREAEGESDEFNDFENVGVDVKYGVTADLTLNATVQPDFGQVEADPATLNLSPFETFFEEKRPFFVEGSRFFQHPDFNLFYSRRIGTGNENSRIRYAGKVTGKGAGGVSMAALFASTDITKPGQAHNPFVNGEQTNRYLVGRVGKDFAEGNYRFNLMQTASFKSAAREDVGDRRSREAYTTGGDFDLSFADREFNVNGSVVASVVDHERLLPADDEDGVGVPASTDTGTGGFLIFQRVAGTIRGNVWGRWEHNKLDLNDLGFLSAPDEMVMGSWMSYRYRPSDSNTLFTQGQFNVNLNKSWLYAGRQGIDENDDKLWAYNGGHRQSFGGNVNVWGEFRSRWSVNGGIWQDAEGTSRFATRGGPLMTTPAATGGWAEISTDYRKAVSGGSSLNLSGDVEGGSELNVYTYLNWRAARSLDFSLSGSYNDSHDDAQWVDNIDNPGAGLGGRSFVFGELDQRTVNLTLRANALFSRNQSLEFYVQPFLTVGDYANARELITPDSYDLVPYTLDAYNVRENDFNFAAVNLNMVYRWEYRPGSALFVVWSHSRDQYDERGPRDDRGDAFNNNIRVNPLFQNEPENTFLVKLSYWFSL